MSPENAINEIRENAINRKSLKTRKVAKMPCISFVSIEQRLRKCGFRTFQVEFTQKVVKTRKV